MKNTISWASSLALSTLVAILPLASCQKETRLADQSTAPQTITRTIAAHVDSIDSPAETKSVYESGVGVHLTNKEYMSVFYAKSSGSSTFNTLTKATSSASPDGSGNWTFSHNEIDGATLYDYAFVLPYTSKNELYYNKLKLRLYFVQYPTTTSFDPNMDYLIGQAQLGKSQATAVKDIKFKRLFAPVRLDIYDTENVLGTEKVHAVSFSIDKTATSTDALVGWIYATPSADYNSVETGFLTESADGTNMPHYGNSVSALNDAGIQKEGDKYSVWFMLNPMEIAANTKIKIEVTTDTKTVTRTASLPSTEAIEKNKINTIKFNISGSGYATTVSSFRDFSTLKGYTAEKMVMSDGSTPLVGSNVSMRNEQRTGNSSSGYTPTGSTVQHCLQFNKSGSMITITPPDNKKLSKIRVYTHMVTASNKAKLELKSGDTSLETKNARCPDVASTAGYLDFEIPTGYASSALTLNYKDSASYLSGITLFYK